MILRHAPDLEKALFDFLESARSGNPIPGEPLAAPDNVMEKVFARPDPRLIDAMGRTLATGLSRICPDVTRHRGVSVSGRVLGFALAVYNAAALARASAGDEPSPEAAFTDALLRRLDPVSDPSDALAHHAVLSGIRPSAATLARDCWHTLLELSPLTALNGLEAWLPAGLHPLAGELLAAPPGFPRPRHEKWPVPDAWAKAAAALAAIPDVARWLHHRWLRLPETREACRNLGLALEALRRQGSCRDFILGFYEAYDYFGAPPESAGQPAWPVLPVIEKLLKSPGESETAIRLHRRGNEYLLKFLPLARIVIAEPKSRYRFSRLTDEFILGRIQPLLEYATEFSGQRVTFTPEPA